MGQGWEQWDEQALGQSSSGTDLQPLQSTQPACLPLKEIDASGSFALICLNMIFFYPTASTISFSSPR